MVVENTSDLDIIKQMVNASTLTAAEKESFHLRLSSLEQRDIRREADINELREENAQRAININELREETYQLREIIVDLQLQINRLQPLPIQGIPPQNQDPQQFQLLSYQ